MPTMSEFSMASLWSIMGFLAVLKGLLPPEVYRYLDQLMRRVFTRMYHTVDVAAEGVFGLNNALYRRVELYLGSIARQADHLDASAPDGFSDIRFQVALGQQIEDMYKGRAMRWRLDEAADERSRSRSRSRSDSKGSRYYTLQVSRKHRDIVEEYLGFIMATGNRMLQKDREKHLFTNMRDRWTSTPLDHPATMETVALEQATKQELISDLIAFKEGKEFYRKIGRAWKRGYLLHGPPGTGKSSLVAAIANFMDYDIYDLELTKVSSNTGLRQLLTAIDDRAVVVVEDIDCSLELGSRVDEGKPKKKSKKQQEPEWLDSSDKEVDEPRTSQVTLSGILNFTDGLWSSCGQEKIFIFTTNYADRLDPALLRPGRMDFRISMSYCSFEMFRFLAERYLNITNHHLYPEVEKLLVSASITPAELIEVLLEHCSQPENAVSRLVERLSSTVAPLEKTKTASLADR